jgi:5-keto-L-gluconate epimerase
MIHYSFMIIPPLPSLGDDSSIQRTFDQIKSCGYTGIELSLSPALDGHLDRLDNWIGERDLVVPSFLTGDAYGDGLCLCSPDAGVRKRTVTRLIEYLDIAERFNAILVIGLLQGLRSDEPDPVIANRRIVDCLREVGEAAAPRGVDLVVEPVNHLQVGFNNSVAEVVQLEREIGSPAWKLMVDTVHMNIEDTSLTQPIYDNAANLRHVHLCDSNGGVFGSGNIDFGIVLDALDKVGYDHFASVKVYRKASMADAIRQSIEYLRGLRSSKK